MMMIDCGNVVCSRAWGLIRRSPECLLSHPECSCCRNRMVVAPRQERGWSNRQIIPSISKETTFYHCEVWKARCERNFYKMNQKNKSQNQNYIVQSCLINPILHLLQIYLQALHWCSFSLFGWTSRSSSQRSWIWQFSSQIPNFSFFSVRAIISTNRRNT